MLETYDPIPSPLSPTSSSVELIEPLPTLGSSFVFRKVEYITEGTHAWIYKVLLTDGTASKNCCLKLFRKDWMTPYNLETTAYEYLRHAGVTYHIPRVFGCGVRTVSEWGLEEIEGDRTGLYYGILMEWLDKAEQVSETNLTVDQAVCLIIGMSKIHEAGVLHNDAYPNNAVVIPGTTRGVWLDFSCAKLGAEDYHKNEMTVAGKFPIQLVNSAADLQIDH